MRKRTVPGGKSPEHVFGPRCRVTNRRGQPFHPNSTNDDDGDGDSSRRQWRKLWHGVIVVEIWAIGTRMSATLGQRKLNRQRSGGGHWIKTHLERGQHQDENYRKLSTAVRRVAVRWLFPIHPLVSLYISWVDRLRPLRIPQHQISLHSLRVCCMSSPSVIQVIAILLTVVKAQ